MKNKCRNIVIYGAGGLGREILHLLKRDYIDEWNVVGFVVDGDKLPVSVNGIRVYPRSFLDNEEVDVILGFADTAGKERIFKELSMRENLSFPNIISKKASVATDANLKNGIFVQDFCSISVNTYIGNCVSINFHTYIGHDTIIEDFCTILPTVNVSGNVIVGRGSLIGAQSFILQGKKIGQEVTVSAGSKVFYDVPDKVTVFGNPAMIKRLK